MPHSFLPSGRRRRVTIHSLERYRIHHPEAERRDVLDALEAGRERTLAEVRAVTGARPGQSAVFVSSADGRGIFVLRGEVIITYLRLDPDQQRALREAEGEDRSPSGWIPLLGVESRRVLVDSDVLDKLQKSRAQLLLALESAVDVRGGPTGVEFVLCGFRVRGTRSGGVIRLRLPQTTTNAVRPAARVARGA